MATKKHLATISIMVKDRCTHAEEMNKLLTQYGHIILARMGLNISQYGLKHCSGFLTLTTLGTSKEINKLTKDLNDLYGIVAKDNIMTL